MCYGRINWPVTNQKTNLKLRLKQGLTKKMGVRHHFTIAKFLIGRALLSKNFIRRYYKSLVHRHQYGRL